MRWWERQPGEREKPDRAFSAFRALGPGRTRREVATILYGEEYRESTKRVPGRIKAWSAEHDWVGRAASYDGWLEMERRDAVEVLLREKAEDHGRREADLQERALRIRERAADQAEKMLEWPLTEQRVNREEDGEQVMYVFTPARWNKATARGFYEMVVGGAPRREEPQDEEFDWEAYTDEELEEYIRLSEKLRPKRPE